MATKVFGTLSDHLDQLAEQYEYAYDTDMGNVRPLLWMGDDGERYEAIQAYWVDRLMGEPTADDIGTHQDDVEIELSDTLKALYELEVHIERDPFCDNKKEERARLLRRLHRLHILREVTGRMGDVEYQQKREAKRADVA